MGLPLATPRPAAAQNAQPSIALPRFAPAPVGDDFFGVSSPKTSGHFQVGAIGNYGSQPFELSDAAGNELARTIEHQLFVHPGFATSFAHRVQFSASLPIAMYQRGDAKAQNFGFPAPERTQLGDLRLGTRVRLVGHDTDALQLSLGTLVWLPTGAEPSYLSDGRARALPQALLGGARGRLIWSGALGSELRRSVPFGNVEHGSALAASAGVAARLDSAGKVQVGPETHLVLTPSNPAPENTHWEALLGGKWRPVDRLQLGLAAGLGLSRGVGTPAFRGLFTVAYAPRFEVSKLVADADGDGFVDEADACPKRSGVAQPDPALNGCPLKDRDNDGVPDPEDACPERPGVPNDDPKRHGCPPTKDSDDDGVADIDDACIDVPGVATPDPKTNGCRPDGDGDGISDVHDACPEHAGPARDDAKDHGCPDGDEDSIVDPHDACPKTPGVASADASKNGCPANVVVTAAELKILQKVEFATGKAKILESAFPLLDEVASAIDTHPELTRIEIQGHTDAMGPDWLNKRLSEDRARSVMQALVDRGVDATRLLSKGYGPSKPVDTNKTDAGRAQNRRVQFVILERSEPKPAPDQE